jgi:hypothetical protein
MLDAPPSMPLCSLVRSAVAQLPRHEHCIIRVSVQGVKPPSP